MKYTRIVEMAVPASSAAESTSAEHSRQRFGRVEYGCEGRHAQLYFAQNGKCRLRMTYWKRKPMIAHGT